MKGLAKLWSIGTLGLILSASPAYAASLTLEAEADTYIRTDLDVRRNDNYGMERIITVGTSRGGGGIPDGGADAMRGLIRFDLSSLPAVPINQAILKLTIFGFPSGLDSSIYTVDVHRIIDSGANTPWVEGNGSESEQSNLKPPEAVWTDAAFGVAWEGIEENNQDQPFFDPAVVASATVSQATNVTGDVIEWDITSLVQDWVNGTVPNFGIMLIDPTTDGSFRELRFGAREGELFNIGDAVAGPQLSITTDEPTTSVPESSSVSSLLVLAVIGTGLQMKRRQQQKA